MLRRLWSPTNLILHEINFHPGLNLIVGRYSGGQSEGSINGIGKSSTVRLIDYMLLSDTADKLFADRRYGFLRDADHQICLELEIAGEVLRLRRLFCESKFVYVQRADEPEFRYSIEEAKFLLGNRFFPATGERQLPGKRFRSLMSFFVKDDIKNYKRDDPSAFVTHGGATEQELAVLNLFLLGLPNRDVVVLGERSEELSAKRRERDAIVRRVEESSGKSLGELRTEIASREKELSALEESLRNLNLLDDFKTVASSITKLESGIATSRSQIDRLDRQISKVRSFTSSTKDVDVQDVAAQYEVISSALGNVVRKTLQEVIAFRASLADERFRFHGRRLRELEDTRERAFETLAQQESERSALLRAIDETRTSESMREAFGRFASRRIELAKIAQGVTDIAGLERDLAGIQTNVASASEAVMKSIDAAESTIQGIREHFLEVVERAISLSDSERTGAYLDISTRPSGSRKKLPVEIKVEIPRGDALGRARLRLVAYDLTVFFHAVDTRVPLPRFLIHDGVFHAIPRRSVVRTLNYIYQRGVRDPVFQYIATFNVDELSLSPQEKARDGEFDFDVETVTVLSLDDNQRRLFRRQF